MRLNEYRDFYEAELEEADAFIRYEAEETGVPEERVIEIMKLEFLAEITYELQRKRYEKAYNTATTQEGKDAALDALLERWN